MKSLSCVRLLVTPWTAAHQAPLSLGFSRQEYWSRVPLPSLKILSLGVDYYTSLKLLVIQSKMQLLSRGLKKGSGAVG